MRIAPSFFLATAACALVASTMVAASSHPSAALQQTAPAAPDPDAPLFNRMCSECHDADRIISARRTKTDWEDVLNKMIEKGATGTEKEFETIYEYLLRNYGKTYINR